MTGLTPMMQQYRDMKQQHPDALLFFRLGDFYELFFEDATIAARELELTLTGRDAGKAAGRVPMCGVPHHAALAYVQRLLAKGYRVAICDQVEDPKQAKGLVRREVTRLITPGTVVDPSMLSDQENTYIAAVWGGPERAGLAYADASTGEFACMERHGADAWRELFDELARLRPPELLVPPAEPGSDLAQLLEAAQTAWQPAVSTTDDWHFGPAARDVLLCHFGTASLQGFDLEGRQWASGAAGALLRYLQTTQRNSLGHVLSLTYYEPGEYMLLDAATRRSLELTRRWHDGGRDGTLLWAVDRTVTSMGARLLRTWLEQPLRRLEPVIARHDAVAALYEGHLIRSSLRELLRQAYDLERLAGRVAGATATPRDMLSLAATLRLIEPIRAALPTGGGALLAQLAGELTSLPDAVALIEQAIAPEPPATWTEGGVIRDGYDPQVDQLRQASREGKRWIAAFAEAERERTGIKSLKVGYNRVFGYYLEVTRANQNLVPDDYERKQTLAGAERYVTPALKEQEALVLGAEEKLTALEAEVFERIRAELGRCVPSLQRTARALAALDVLAGFAELAADAGYVRPHMSDGDALVIRQGRHPVLDRLLAGRFVPNDTELGGDGDRLLLVTGPNMGGKSTYLRQVALIVLLAQAGSFVPAAAATVGLVDRIFSRVGAADDLATGQSTFMVEMHEVARILHAATERSLLILDEVGRGTSTQDGLALAWALVEHLHTELRARTLFATHYHELTGLEDVLPQVGNCSVAVQETGEQIVFLHAVVPGGADRSYGLHVAKLAGVPAQVLARAAVLLSELEQTAGARQAAAEAAAAAPPRASRPSAPSGQLSLLPDPAEAAAADVVAELKATAVDELTPLAALNLLHKWRQRLTGEERAGD